MSATFCAFDFSPAALALPQAEVVVATMANLFRWGWWGFLMVAGLDPVVEGLRQICPLPACGPPQLAALPPPWPPRRDQPALCEGFWSGDRPTGACVLHPSLALLAARGVRQLLTRLAAMPLQP
jgi:hypothetical protein